MKDVVYYSVRVSPIPARFEGEGSDRLMNSIIGTYSNEKFVNNKPTGEFFLDKHNFENISYEVVKTHVDKEHPWVYLKDRLPKTWEKFEKKTGRI